jgi:hypothetical protein
MKRYSRDADRTQESDEAFQKRIEVVKQQALLEQEQKWQEMEEKERLLRAQEFYKQQRKEESLDFGMGYWNHYWWDGYCWRNYCDHEGIPTTTYNFQHVYLG